MAKISFNNKQTDFTPCVKEKCRRIFSPAVNIKQTGNWKLYSKNDRCNCDSDYDLLAAGFCSTCRLDQSSSLRTFGIKPRRHRFQCNARWRSWKLFREKMGQWNHGNSPLTWWAEVPWCWKWSTMSFITHTPTSKDRMMILTSNHSSGQMSIRNVTGSQIPAHLFPIIIFPDLDVVGLPTLISLSISP